MTAPLAATLTVRFATPCCGVEFGMCSRHAQPLKDDWIKNAAENITYWHDERMARHRCELVTEDNPMGLAPKQKTSA